MRGRRHTAPGACYVVDAGSGVTYAMLNGNLLAPVNACRLDAYE